MRIVLATPLWKLAVDEGGRAGGSRSKWTKLAMRMRIRQNWAWCWAWCLAWCLAWSLVVCCAGRSEGPPPRPRVPGRSSTWVHVLETYWHVPAPRADKDIWTWSRPDQTTEVPSQTGQSSLCIISYAAYACEALVTPPNLTLQYSIQSGVWYLCLGSRFC